ncbi:AAA family ATPase [Streptomyces sp. NPDC001922]|uniref:AAA family ATPase n=1 Tax=Streptomyces sp. NPDC001922 TaxID=3364624 RepID=UPI00369D127C
MRLHRLRITAFGPFGGTAEVDFDDLSAAGLFLLHGPTGAGKTSVLDAVCFALYGGVPGARQSGHSLRSDHADPLTPTEVLLDLTVGGRRLEITRRPEQPRPKKRGSGFTRDKAQTWLRERTEGEWRPLSRSHQEAGEEIGQLLGMSKEQFCQVVLLPQGDFARFLRADAEARGRLLGRLFDTRRFAAVEERLAELRAAAQQQVRSGDERLLALAHRMQQAALRGPEPPFPALGGPDGTAPAVPAQRSAARTRQRAEEAPPVPGEPGLAGTVLSGAAVARTSAREWRTVCAAAVRAAEAAHAAAVAELETVREQDRLRQRYDAAVRRRTARDALREERESARTRLDRARSADTVVPALRLRDTAAAGHREAAAAAGRARAALPDGLREAPRETLAELEREARQELGSLAAARRTEERGTALAAELADLERQSRADDEVLTEAAHWLDRWDTVRRDHQQRVERAAEAATRAEHLAGRLDPARRRLDAARRRDTLTGQVRAGEERLLEARGASAAAQEAWLDLKERRLLGIAAELAASLREGEPCVVCGAPDHPDPAPLEADHVGRTDEEAALAAYRRADTRREEADQRLRSVREALAAADTEADGAATDRLAGEVAEHEQALSAARAEAADAHAAREALDRIEREHAERRDEHQAAERRMAARTSRRETLLREQAAVVEELTRARGTARSVAERVTELERRAALLETAEEAAHALERAESRLGEAGTGLADAAGAAGFPTAEDAAGAVLAPEARRALEHRLAAWEAEDAALTAEFADPQLVAAGQRPPADPAAAQTALDAATRRLRDASAADEAARTRCAELDRLGTQATLDARRLAPQRAEYERVARMAALTAGTSAQNERKMRLESYVLAARLEQVAAAASSRLHRMSAGRYTLVHSDARNGGRGRSGLGLHVIDSWTGHERDTATLSGGETFFASLALALGLADVVSEEAGGTRLDTLFIDEGFGSLDEQTLDEVLEVLDSLRERDRTVGIVSHVADLRQRIPARLEVAKARSGSAVRHRAPEATG